MKHIIPRLTRHTLAAVACILLFGCSSATEPAPVFLQVSGTVRAEGTLAPVAGIRVILADRRSIYDIAYQLGVATTSASGGYAISAESRRPGYTNSCEFVLVFVEGHENTSAMEVGCTPQPQTIDLLIFDF